MALSQLAPVPPEAPKPGSRTTEFWMAMVVNALLLGLPAIGVGSEEAGQIGTAVTTLGYAVARGVVKYRASK